MCGRTACSLCPEDLRKACSYRNKETQKFELPKWHSVSENYHPYKPSPNIAPTETLPVMVSGEQFCAKSERVVMPMIWGMIPSWHKGDHKKHGLSTHNCRVESLLSSKMYLPPYKHGQRCVVLSEGYYEWQKDKSNPRKKIPHYLYMPQPEGVDISNQSSWNREWNEDEGWKGPRLLAMAGVFDTWTSPEGDKVFSCSIFTTKAADNLNSIHDRMPVILENEEAIESWLDVDEKTCMDVFPLLESSSILVHHQVSHLVNNSRFKDDECVKPVNPDRPTLKSSAAHMAAWLRGEFVKPKAGGANSEDDSKRVKLEESVMETDSEPSVKPQEKDDIEIDEPDDKDPPKEENVENEIKTEN